ncbi:MAG: DUF2693 domain-containing protein [Proteobacteria bacterium]|nr:DUF2693 domain-containing protein [Pseudomonadota bacterium]
MKPKTIVKRLLSGTWVVVFRKVSDDSIREMKCSLMEEFVGPPTKQNKAIKKNKEVLPVWDIDSKGWRSFRFDSVITMKELTKGTVEK